MGVFKSLLGSGKSLDRVQQLPSLNGFRALSVLSVLISHCAITHGWSSVWFVHGDVGVRCFFVISGFLITHLLLVERRETGAISLSMFYARRALRILPVFFAFMIAITVLAWLTAHPISGCQYLTALTFTKNFGCRYGWIDTHLWSLSVEEQFYLLWPWLMARRPLRDVLAVALVLIIAGPIGRSVFYLLHDFDSRAISTVTNADMIMIGCVCAIFVSSRRDLFMRMLQWRPAGMRFFALLALIAPTVLSINLPLGRFTVPFGATTEATAVAYLLCSYAFVPKGVMFYVLNWRPLVYLGAISYGVYVWQQPFFSPITRLPIIVTLGGILSVAALSYYLLEKPLMTLRSRLRASRTGLALRPALPIATVPNRSYPVSFRRRVPPILPLTKTLTANASG
jgi:peptidoglycan/LPS O-acetylase OafA/YrhL